MRPTARESVRLAYSQVGYKATGPGKKNKYAKWFDTHMTKFFNGKKNGVGVDWCAIFVCFCVAYLAKTTTDACFVLCTPLKSCAAGVGWLWKYFKAKKRTSSVPHYGDVIFLNSKTKKLTHVGIVYKVEGNYVYWVAGNEGGGHGSVKKHKYLTSNSRIYGYGRPRYTAEKS